MINLIKNILLKIVDIFFLLRILLLVPVWTIVVLGWITSNPEASLGGNIANYYASKDLWTAILFFSMVVASIYVTNQIMDVESDRINRKLFILPNGLVSIKLAWIISFVSAAVGLAGGYFFFDVNMFFIFLFGIIVGILYNLPPFQLKNSAWGGTIANFVGHGVITYLVGWYAVKYNLDHNFITIRTGLLSSLTAGFANAAVYLATTIPDADGDSRVGKKTFAVRYGEKKTAIAAAVSCVLSFVTSFLLAEHSWVMVVPAALSSILFAKYLVSGDKESVFRTFKWPVAILSISVLLYVPLYGVMIFIALVISRVYYKLRFNYKYPTF